VTESYYQVVSYAKEVSVNAKDEALLRQGQEEEKEEQALYFRASVAQIRA
jgi:hypothetical protein